MAWVYLVIAGMMEVLWAIGLKYTNGWTRLAPSVLTAIGMMVSFYFLSLAVKTLPIGTAYAVWTGIGAVGTVVVGMLFLGEPRDLLRIGFLVAILVGLVGLKLTA